MTTVYVKPACVQCDATKRFLDKAGIDYNTIDITKDAEALDKVLGMGFQAAPIVVTDNDAWSGFNPDKLGEIAA